MPDQGATRNIPRFRFSFARIICLTFLGTILLGSTLIYQLEGSTIGWINSVYLATSAVCVTGLTPIPLSQLSRPTQSVILFLVQVGGLGTLVFAIFIGRLVLRGESRNSNLQTLLAKANVEEGMDVKNNEALNIFLSTIRISLSIELAGIIVLYSLLPEDIPDRLYFSIFTSISAFNNAGFSVTDDLSILKHHYVAVNWIAFLVILGAIGFPVIITLEKRILEILHKFLERKIIAYEETQLLVRAIQGENVGFLIRIAQATEKLGEFIERYNHNLNSGTHPIQTKILLRGTIYLLMTSTIIIMILEWNSPNYILGDGFWDKLHHAFFLAACSRSAGFNIVPLSELSTASFVTIILLMGIGGAPQGTAGGLKITTFVILIAYIKNLFNPEEKITVYGKEISKVSSAVAIRLYLLTTVVLGIYLLLLTTLHRGFSLEFVAFEMVSAFGTVGYSLGITPFIGDVEKLLYSLLMFMGRVGILNLLVAFSGHSGIPKIPETGDPVRLQVG